MLQCCVTCAQAAVLADTLQLDWKESTLCISKQLSDSQSGVLGSTRFLR